MNTLARNSLYVHTPLHPSSVILYSVTFCKLWNTHSTSFLFHTTVYSHILMQHPSWLIWFLILNGIFIDLGHHWSYIFLQLYPQSLSVNSILWGLSTSMRNSTLAIINPWRSKGKTTLPNPTRPAWYDCCLVIVSCWLACVETEVSRIPQSLWHFQTVECVSPWGTALLGTHMCPLPSLCIWNQ